MSTPAVLPAPSLPVDSLPRSKPTFKRSAPRHKPRSGGVALGLLPAAAVQQNILVPSSSTGSVQVHPDASSLTIPKPSRDRSARGKKDHKSGQGTHIPHPLPPKPSIQPAHSAPPSLLNQSASSGSSSRTRLDLPPKPRLSRAQHKMQKQGEHLNLVQTAARSVSEILSKENMDCCLFGSLAAKMFGNNRCPKDADILILQRPGYPTLDAEALKRLIAEKRPKNFYLKMPKDPEAPYRILWFSLRGPPPPTKASSSSLEATDAKPKQRNHRLASECKVDILIPGTLSLPHLPATRITWIEDIPCIPYPVLLLQKLQSWDDHRNMKGDDLWKRKKMPTDAADVRRLLNLKIVVQENVVKPGIEIVWKDAELFDDEQFMTVSRRRVRKYCEAHPDRAAEWKRLGFEVGPVDDPTDDEVEVVKEGAGGAVDEEEDLDDLDEEE